MISPNRRRTEHQDHLDTMGTNIYSSKDNQSLHKSLNGEFILYQILLQQILDGTDPLAPSTSSISNSFEPDNPIDKDLMEEFDTKYKSSEAIHWYTRETPIYKLLNKALRTQTINDVNAFSQFIRDLNQQLKKEQILFINEQKTSTIQVCRGQFISIDEINRLKSSQGQLFSMNSFLSTSTNKEKAVEFATSRSPPNDQLRSILLEIDIDLHSNTKAYADIKHLSAFPEEEEILFMFGSIFRLNQIYYDEQIKLWIAKLKLCSQDDQDLKDFSSTLEHEIKGQNHFISLGNYFIHMQKYQEAEAHYRNVLQFNLTNNSTELAYCYHGLSNVNQKKGDYNSAITNLNKALHYLLENSSTNDHSLISQSYNDLGYIYSKQKNYLMAFQFYEKALKTTNNNSSTTYFSLAQIQFDLGNSNLALEYLQKSLDKQSEADHSSIANIYIHMGKVYSQMNQKEKATEMFDKAIESQLKNLSPQHPDLSYTYIAQGLMYSDINDEQKAFEYIEKAYQLQLQSLPSNHSDFTQTYLHFGDLYMKKGDLDEALSYYHKALENQLKTLLWDHPSVAETYLTIGNVHWKKKDYDQALIYFHKILDIELVREEFGDPSLTNAFKHLGDLYFEKGDMDQALVFYLQNLDNELVTKVHGDISLADTYKIIANIYYKKRLLKQSLLYSNRLLDCHLRKQPVDESIIAEIYKKIAKVSLKSHHFDETLLYYDTSKVNTAEDIDNIYFEKRHLDRALNHFDRILHEQLKSHSKNDPLLCDTYQVLGDIYFEKQNFHKALKYYVKLLENKLCRKTSDDPSLSNIYKMIGNIYLKKEKYNKSLIYFNRLIDCQLLRKTVDDPSVTNTYQRIGEIYLKKDHFNQLSNYLNQLIENKSTNNQIKRSTTDFQFEKHHVEQTLIYFQKLLKTRSFKYFTLEQIYHIIGTLFLEKLQFNQALNYFQQLTFYLIQKDPLQYLSLGKTYEIIANIYQDQSNTNQALQYYKKALISYQQINPINENLTNKIEHNIHSILGTII